MRLASATRGGEGRGRGQGKGWGRGAHTVSEAGEEGGVQEQQGQQEPLVLQGVA